jgi:uncharacterized membrane protein
MKARIGILGALALLLIGLFAMSAVAITPDWIKVNGNKVDEGRTYSVERDQGIDIVAQVSGGVTDVDDARLVAELEGYEYGEIRDVSDIFKVKADRTYVVEELHLDLPGDMEKGLYNLRLTFKEGKLTVDMKEYLIDIDASRHKLEIDDVVFSPENNVKAGRSLLATVRVENVGDNTEEDIKVTVSIPELGISASDYIDELEKEDAKNTEELYMRIPTCAEAKEYDVVTVVSYDSATEEAEQVDKIEVVEGDLCEANVETTEVSIGPQSQDVEAGESVIFPVTIKNNGRYGQTYTVSVTGADSFADVQINPANVVVLAPGESQAVYVYVGAREDASEGAHMFTLAVKAGTNVVEEYQLTANVKESGSGWDSVKKGLEIGLIVLVVLLIILGLVIAFNKMKGNEEETEEEASGQTYY